MPLAQKPSVGHDGSPPPMPSHTKHQENLLQALFQNQDEQQVLQKIQDLIDDWRDTRETQLAWNEYELTGMEGTLSYDEYRERHLDT